MTEKFDFAGTLTACAFVPRLRGDTKQSVIEELIDALIAGGQLHDRAGALRAITEREAKMSTGMQDGVALPHGKTESVSRLVSAIGLKPGGMDFKALDGKPSTIVVLVLSAVLRAQEHTDYLAGIGRCLSCPAVRDKLLGATTRDEAIRVLTET